MQMINLNVYETDKRVSKRDIWWNRLSVLQSAVCSFGWWLLLVVLREKYCWLIAGG
jgi:hypothetical protein